VPATTSVAMDFTAGVALFCRVGFCIGLSHWKQITCRSGLAS
jgi:hypothetical protein